MSKRKSNLINKNVNTRMAEVRKLGVKVITKRIITIVENILENYLARVSFSKVYTEAIMCYSYTMQFSIELL